MPIGTMTSHSRTVIIHRAESAPVIPRTIDMVSGKPRLLV